LFTKHCQTNTTRRSSAKATRLPPSASLLETEKGNFILWSKRGLTQQHVGCLRDKQTAKNTRSESCPIHRQAMIHAASKLNAKKDDSAGTSHSFQIWTQYESPLTLIESLSEAALRRTGRNYYFRSAHAFVPDTIPPPYFFHVHITNSHGNLQRYQKYPDFPAGTRLWKKEHHN